MGKKENRQTFDTIKAKFVRNYGHVLKTCFVTTCIECQKTNGAEHIYTNSTTIFTDHI